MNWLQLNDLSQLDNIVEDSKNQPIVIFKHSTRCSISSTAINRFEKAWLASEGITLKPYYLDLLNYREISNSIEAKFGVEHQSPQAILIKDGKAIYNSSHFDISLDSILQESQK